MQYLIIVSVIWGFSFVLIKGSLVSLDSNFVSFIRLLLSFAVFVPFTRLGGIKSSEKLQLMLIGSVQFGLMYVAYVASYQYLPAYAVALMTTTTPLYVALFDDLYEKRIHKAFLAAASLAVAGGAVILYTGESLSAGLIGLALLQMSNAAFAFGQIAYKKLTASKPGFQDKSVFGLMYGGAVLVTGLFSLATTNYRQLSLEPHQWIALLYLGIVASGLGFFLWNLGARKVNEGILAVMNNLKVPRGVVASLVILREGIGYIKLWIGCLLFASALWVNGRYRKPVSER
jgi:drug/metabolite transporter (DMT)-like permease